MTTNSTIATPAPVATPEWLKRQKLDRIAKLMKWRNRFRREDSLYNCLTADLAKMAGVEDTENVSRNAYDPKFEEIIFSNPDKMILDVGASYRPVDHANVVNLEIVRYPTTDVLGVAEALPFKSGVFDYLHSNAVLEHVRNPFKCAEEIVRVLKPGGVFWIAVPFLQPAWISTPLKACWTLHARRSCYEKMERLSRLLTNLVQSFLPMQRDPEQSSN